MTRPLRIHYPEAVYHVTARGVRRLEIFRDDEDRLIFLLQLRMALDRYGAVALAYCLMSNHFHLAIQIGIWPLERIMKAALERYARIFNAKYGFEGHLFEDRHYPKLCRSGVYLARMIRYIQYNPVPIICARPEDWRWSSWNAYAKGAPDPLLDVERARAILELSGVDPLLTLEDGGPMSPESCYLRTDLALSEVPPAVDLTAVLRDEAAYPRLAELVRGPSRERSVSELRKAFCVKATRAGATNKQIARFLGRHQSYVSRTLSSR